MRQKIKSLVMNFRFSLVKSGASTYNRQGFTLIELLLVIAIVGTLVAVAIPNYVTILNKSRNRQAIADLAINGTKLSDHLIDHGSLPEALEEAGCKVLHDPWGMPFQYLRILGQSIDEVRGQWRKDRFLVPINSDFDLYSCGLDGETTPALTAAQSRDDLIRASNGDFIGIASKY